MRGIVARNSSREHKAFPRARRDFETLQLTKHFKRSVFAPYLSPGSNVLPAQQPVHELRRRHRLDLLAEGRDRQPMNTRQ